MTFERQFQLVLPTYSGLMYSDRRVRARLAPTGRRVAKAVGAGLASRTTGMFPLSRHQRIDMPHSRYTEVTDTSHATNPTCLPENTTICRQKRRARSLQTYQRKSPAQEALQT